MVRSAKMSMYKFRVFHISPVEDTGNQITGRRGPNPRSGHRCVVDHANLYSFGGYNPHVGAHDDAMMGDANWPETCPLFRELWRFNLATRCWTKVTTEGHTPKELASHAALLTGHYLLVFGGTGVPFGFSSSNSLHLCDLRTHQWKKVSTTGSLPPKQYGQAMTLVGKSLYVIGGTTGYEYSIDVHKLDLNSLIWEELETSEKPKERYRHEVASDGNRIFVFGGGTATESTEFTEIPAFNLQSNKWELVQTQPDTSCSTTVSDQGYPCARRCHSLVHRGEVVFICGGYNGEEIFPDIWQINLRTLAWQRLQAELPQPVYFHSAALTDSGCMYIFGGVTHIGENTRTSEVYSMWLSVPKLKEMCWQALLKYVPNVGSVPRVTLLQMGVPLEYVDRIDYQALNS